MFHYNLRWIYQLIFIKDKINYKLYVYVVMN